MFLFVVCLWFGCGLFVVCLLCVCCLLFAVCCLLFVACCLPLAGCRLPFAIRCLLFVVCCLSCVVCRVLGVVCRVLCVVCCFWLSVFLSFVVCRLSLSSLLLLLFSCGCVAVAAFVFVPGHSALRVPPAETRLTVYRRSLRRGFGGRKKKIDFSFFIFAAS